MKISARKPIRSSRFCLLFQCFFFLSSNAFAADDANGIALYKAVGINSEQQSSIQEQIDSFEKLTISKGQIMIRLMQEMRVLSLQPMPDANSVLSKQSEINSLNNEMAMERARLLLRLRAILNPSQQKKFVQLLQVSSESK